MPLLPAVVLLGVAPASCVCSEVRANGARAVATAVCVASAALLGVARTEGFRRLLFNLVATIAKSFGH